MHHIYMLHDIIIGHTKEVSFDPIIIANHLFDIIRRMKTKMSQHQHYRSPLSLLTIAALCLFNAATTVDATTATEAEPKRMLRQRVAKHNRNNGVSCFNAYCETHLHECMRGLRIGLFFGHIIYMSCISHMNILDFLIYHIYIIIPQERSLQEVLQGGSSSNTSDNVNTNMCKSLIAVGGWRRNDIRQEVHQLRTREQHQRFLGHNQNHTLLYHTDETEEDVETDEDFVCELYDGSTLPIQATQEQMHQLRSMLNRGELVSAESTIEVEAEHHVESEGSIGIEEEGIIASSIMTTDDEPSASGAPQYVSLPQGSVKVVNNGNNDDRRQRRLGNTNNNNNMYEGDKQILIVRVTDKDGRAVPENAKVLSDKFFGTYGDKVTMKSGFNDCSFGKFRVATDYGNRFNDNLFSAEGVIDVDIDVKLTKSTQAKIRVSAAAAVEKKLGVSLPGPFDHVVFVVEDCYEIGTTCQFAAYAFINHWFSFFIEDNYKFPAVTMQ